MTKFYKQDVAEKEAVECARRLGGTWYVLKYQFDYDVIKAVNISKNEERLIVFRVELGR